MNINQIRIVTLVSIFIAGLLLYGFTMPSTVTFEDAGLFLQVCHFGGIAHPPGYPLFSLICTPLFSWLPFNPVIIGNSISAVFGALTACMLYLILRRLEISYWFAVLGAVLLTTAKAFWSQAIIIEVYTLNTLFTLTCLYLSIRFQQSGEERWLYLLIFCFCLGLSNHWPLMVLCLPGFAIIVLARWQKILSLCQSARLPGIILGSIFLGFLPYVWLFQAEPAFSYSGGLTSLQNFVSYFLRESFAGADQHAVSDGGDKINYIGWSLGHILVQNGLWFGLFFIPGFLLTYKRWGVHLYSGLLLILIFHAIVLCLLLGFDFDYIFRAVMSTYLLTAYMAALIFVIAGLQLCHERINSVPVRHLASASIVIFTGLTIFLNAQSNNRSEDTLAHDYAYGILTSLEDNAALVITSDAQAFPIGYLHNVVDIRPDVTLYHGGNLFFRDKLSGTTDDELAAAVEVLSGQRTVYSIGIPWLTTGTDLGIISVEDTDEFSPPALDKKLNALVAKLVLGYVNRESNQPHNLYFLHQLFYDASLHLTEYSTYHHLETAELNLMLDLQTTFPGVLATLAIALSNNRFNPSVEMLMALARPYIDNMPVETETLHIAYFYYYLSFIEKDKNSAADYLERSAGIYPVDDNPGFVAWTKRETAEQE
jgi:hypothetical protein